MTKYLDNEGLTHFTGKMKEYADGKAGEVDGKVTTHVGNKQNPHGVTKAQVGLSKVINETQIPSNQKGLANGVATLDAKGKVPVEQMPDIKTINGDPIFGKGDLQLSASLYKIVDTLPTTGIDTSKIYLVPASATTAKNNKTEYIYLGDPNKAYDESKWEKLGDEQKSSTITTPGGSIKVDTALIKDSPNPVAGGVVKAKFDEVDGKLAKKVESSDYTTKMTAIDSTLEDLKKKETITVDVELKDSPNPVQNRAVNAAVQNLNTEIGKKANSTDLNAAAGKITTLETNAATKVIEKGEGNGISGISKSGNTITAKKATFLTSAAGLATTAALNDGLAGKADIDHNHDTKYAAKKHTHPEYAQSSALNDYVTNTALSEKKFLTDTSLAGYMNDVQPDGTSGNGIAGITKDGKVLKVTKSTFLTQGSLANYATKTWVGEQGFAKGTIPTKVSQLTNDSGFLTQQSLNGYWNQLYVDERDGNGIADIWVDVKNKSELCVSKRTFITPETLGTSIDDYAKDKGYLTKEDMKETVVIKLVSDKSASDTNLNGATVTVKSGDTTVSTQTWQGTPINVKVPCDKDVTIEAAAVKMYIKPKMLKYIPSPLYNREVIFTYKAQETGVFIIDKNNKTYKTTGEFTQSGLPKTDIVGALLVTDKVAIVIVAQLSYEAKWSNKNGLIDGCTVNSDATVAAQDFAGAANTAAIIKANAGLDTAASKCNNYVFKNGKKGHLMSGGEAIEIQKNFNRINSVLEYINSSNTLDENRSYWTSTQKGSDTAWGIRMGDSTLFESYITLPGTSVMGVNATFPIYSLYD